ncbi:MAG: cell division protein SepF [Clostridia bacterium]|nr:cell division protein SepF [Clostridia bacterium]MBQ9861767.1 cell division protein SepF [Clostridia bacterium]
MGFLDKLEGLFGDQNEETIGLENEEFVSRSPEKEVEDVPRKNNKVVNIHATAQLQVVLVKPERFDDASAVADHLNAKRTVVLNLESSNKDVARRILDFLSGVAYANNGQIKKVANCTYIITPYNVGFMGDLLDELENNGLYF